MFLVEMFLGTHNGFDSTLGIFFCISLLARETMEYLVEHIVHYFNNSKYGIFGRTQPALKIYFGLLLT